MLMIHTLCSKDVWRCGLSCQKICYIITQVSTQNLLNNLLNEAVSAAKIRMIFGVYLENWQNKSLKIGILEIFLGRWGFHLFAGLSPRGSILQIHLRSHTTIPYF